MPKRLVIPVEFSSIKEEEILFFMKLKGYTYPGALIKDILMGRIPLSILEEDKSNARDKRS